MNSHLKSLSKGVNLISLSLGGSIEGEYAIEKERFCFDIGWRNVSDYLIANGHIEFCRTWRNDGLYFINLRSRPGSATAEDLEEVPMRPADWWHNNKWRMESGEEMVKSSIQAMAKGVLENEQPRMPVSQEEFMDMNWFERMYHLLSPYVQRDRWLISAIENLPNRENASYFLKSLNQRIITAGV